MDQTLTQTRRGSKYNSDSWSRYPGKVFYGYLYTKLLLRRSCLEDFSNELKKYLHGRLVWRAIVQHCSLFHGPVGSVFICRNLCKCISQCHNITRGCATTSCFRTRNDLGLIYAQVAGSRGEQNTNMYTTTYGLQTRQIIGKCMRRKVV